MSSSKGLQLAGAAAAAALVAGLSTLPAYAQEILPPESPVTGEPVIPLPPSEEPSPLPPVEEPTPAPPVYTPPPPAQTSPRPAISPGALPPAPVPSQNVGQENPFDGYPVHPGTGYVIEPGTNNLIDARTGLYTELRWDPVTDTISSVFNSVEETEESEASPKASERHTKPPESAAPAAAKKPTPAPSQQQSVAHADRASAESGIGWSTHWLTRTGVFLALTGAGVAFYMKLQKGTPRIGKS